MERIHGRLFLRGSLILFLSLTLQACALFQTKPDADAVSLSDLSTVINELKKELSVYSTWKAQAPPKNNSSGVSQEICGIKGETNDIEITSAKIDLTAKDKSSISAKIGLPSIGILSVTGPEGKREVTNEQKLAFDVGIAWITANNPPVTTPQKADMDDHPIAALIYKTRQQILNIAHQEPCVLFINDKKEPRYQILTIAFTAVKTGTAGGSITLLPITIGASGSKEGTTGQILTLTFKVTGPISALIP